MQIPHEFMKQVPTLYGEPGATWLNRLPNLIEACESRFGIHIDAPFSDLSWNLLMKADLPGSTPVVLKLGPHTNELMKEAAVLQQYAGRGAARVIDVDRDLGAIVLERITPGTPLADMEDDEAATAIFCAVFQQLHPGSIVPSEGVPSLQENFAAIPRYRHRYKGDNGPLPEAWVQRAQAYLDILFASTTDAVLLHGDLHHGNMLQKENGTWAVIDPKGWIGDAHFDTIQYLLNHVTRGGDADTVLSRRIGLMSQKLRLSPSRIAMWGVARGVLEACWSLEDSIGSDDWESGIEISGRFARYLASLD